MTTQPTCPFRRICLSEARCEKRCEDHQPEPKKKALTDVELGHRLAIHSCGVAVFHAALGRPGAPQIGGDA